MSVLLATRCMAHTGSSSPGSPTLLGPTDGERCYRGDAVILLELFINALLGFVFVLCARDRIRADGPVAAPSFWFVVMFAGLVATPAALYFYIVHPAWSWLYALDPSTIPAVMVGPVLIIVVGGLFGAWFGGSQLIRTGRDRAFWISLGVTATLALSITLFTSDRLILYGSYEVFAAGEARGLLEVKLGYVLIAFALGLGAAAGFVGVELLRDSRQARIRRVPRLGSSTPSTPINPVPGNPPTDASENQPVALSSAGEAVSQISADAKPTPFHNKSDENSEPVKRLRAAEPGDSSSITAQVPAARHRHTWSDE